MEAREFLVDQVALEGDTSSKEIHSRSATFGSRSFRFICGMRRSAPPSAAHLVQQGCVMPVSGRGSGCIPCTSNININAWLLTNGRVIGSTYTSVGAILMIQPCSVSSYTLSLRPGVEK